MNKIIILKANSNTGKTTKINTIADWIITTHGAANTIGLDPAHLTKDSCGVLTVGKLNILVNSAGDDHASVLKIDAALQSFHGQVDIILCSCRTKGITYQHLYKNYNRSTGWLDVIIPIAEFTPANPTRQAARDAALLAEIQAWLTGLPKL
ncbi:hypothetical protein [Flavobacterium magnum]|nr:hypothetical protein [Flavobacterium magnum]